MQYFASKVWSITQELHQGCGGSIAFKVEPVNSFNIETALANLKNNAYDFVLAPPLGTACITSYGVTHLLTRSKNRYMHDSSPFLHRGLFMRKALFGLQLCRPFNCKKHLPINCM